jgi:hypothetical protein
MSDGRQGTAGLAEHQPPRWIAQAMTRAPYSRCGVHVSRAPGRARPVRPASTSPLSAPLEPAGRGAGDRVERYERDALLLTRRSPPVPRKRWSLSWAFMPRRNRHAGRVDGQASPNATPGLIISTRRSLPRVHRPAPSRPAARVLVRMCRCAGRCQIPDFSGPAFVRRNSRTIWCGDDVAVERWPPPASAPYDVDLLEPAGEGAPGRRRR